MQKNALHPKEISIQEYNYELPEERIARYPLANRDDSKLLIYNNGFIQDTAFKKITDLIPVESLLVFNNSKVIEARVLFQKATGGVIEIFTLEPHEQYADITTAMQTSGSILYKCLVGGASKWKHGMVLSKFIDYKGQEIVLEAKIADRRADSFIIQFSWQPAALSFAEILHATGNIPIPPYLHREAEASDTERYQTVYAKADGSVAAPTAGLHFTDSILQALQAKAVDLAFTTLHVGAGTFMPVKTETMEAHQMHAEFIEVTPALLNDLQQHDTVIAVGTTSMRTLESIYWMGLKTLQEPTINYEQLQVRQWEVYELNASATKNEALQALAAWMKRSQLERLIIKTQILIAPGYSFKIAGALITNFHQPQSTLLLLVSAFIGPDWKAVYRYAMEHDFRFLSYGDSSLLFRNNPA